MKRLSKKRSHKTRLLGCMIKAGMAVAALACFGVILYHVFSAGGAKQTMQAVSPSGGKSVSSRQSSSSAASPAKKDFSVSFIAAGDNIIHNVVYRDASRYDGGKGYSFSQMYADIKPVVSANDFAFVNQETILAGNKLPLSNYPCFNSPQEVGDALVGAGFNLISQANNHSLDKGFTGIKLTSAFWKKQKGVVMSGIYTSRDDYSQIRYLTKKGVTVALIAGTWSTNGIPVPKDKKWCVETSFSKILNKVRQARENADIVLVSMHWGVEYSTKYTEKQVSQAKQLAEAGADIIIGNHPHAIQNIKWIKTSDNRRVIVAYALGNLLSGQNKFGTMVGGLLQMKITRKNGVVTLSNVKYRPVVTYFTSGYRNFRTVLLSQYTDAMASKHGLTYKGIDMSPSRIRKYVTSIISPQFLK